MTKITTNLTINVRIFIINLFNYNSLLKTVTIYLYNYCIESHNSSKTLYTKLTQLNRLQIQL